MGTEIAKNKYNNRKQSDLPIVFEMIRLDNEVFGPQSQEDD